MPFVKELCKCVKHFGADGAVHWEERALKIALGSCGSPKCTGRVVDLNQLSIHKLWVSIKLFSYAQKTHHHDCLCVGLECKRHCFFSFCVKNKSFPLLRRSWSSGVFCFVIKVCFAPIGHLIYWVYPRAAEPATILSNCPLVVGIMGKDRGHKTEQRKGRNRGCMSDSAFCCQHQFCLGCSGLGLPALDVPCTLRLGVGVKAESWHW